MKLIRESYGEQIKFRVIMLNAYFEVKKSVTDRNNHLLKLFLEVNDEGGCDSWTADANVELSKNGNVIVIFSVFDQYDDYDPEEIVIEFPVKLYETGTDEQIIAFLKEFNKTSSKALLIKSTIDDLQSMAILRDVIGGEKFDKCVEFVKGGNSQYLCCKNFVDSLLGDHNGPF